MQYFLERRPIRNNIATIMKPSLHAYLMVIDIEIDILIGILYGSNAYC